MDRKTEPNWRERALFLFSPKRAQEAYAQRLKREREPESGTDRRARMAASGYGAHAASSTLNSMLGYNAAAAAQRTTSTCTARFCAQGARPV